MKILYSFFFFSIFINSAFSVDDANAFVTKQQNFYLYNPHYKQYLFVSDDEEGFKNVDFVVEGKLDIDQKQRSVFQFQDYPHDSGTQPLFKKQGHYLIFNPAKQEYLFVCGNKKGGDHIVESRKSIMERSVFDIRWVDRSENIINIYNPSYNAWLFLSGDKMGRFMGAGGDNVLEARIGKKYQGKCDFKIIY